MDRKEILEKPLWSLQDIKKYFDIGQTKASQMMKAAKRISCSRYLPSKAKRDILLELNGLTFKEEISKMQMLEVGNG